MSGNWLEVTYVRVLSRLIVAGLAILIFTVNPLKAAMTIDELVVTATRMEEKGFDVPTPIEAVSSETMTINSPATAAQSLAELPGVSLSSAGLWQATPVIRGLGGSRVLVLIDGDRENNLWAGRAPLTPFIDAGNIERIEVIKGPASVLYGTDALGGVINVISKQPDFAKAKKWTFLNSVSGRYSSVDDGWFGRYSLSGGGYGFDFELALSALDADDYQDGAGDDVENSQFENNIFDFKGRYFINDDHDLSMTIRISDINDMGEPKKQGARYSHFDKFDADTYKLAYHGRNLGWLKDLQIKSWYVDQERSYEADIPSLGKPIYKLKGNEFETSALGASFQGQVDFSQDNRLIFGCEFVAEDADGDEYIKVNKNKKDIKVKELTFKPIPDCDRDHFGIFAQDEIIFGESLTMLAGLRYDYFVADADDAPFTTDVYDPEGENIIKSSTTINNFGRKSDDAVTFNLGLLYALTDNIHLTSNLSSGFRAPDMFERYSTRSSTYMIIGNPDLDPEYSYNSDFGFKLNYQRLRATCSGFYNRVEDYIELADTGRDFAGMEAREYINVDDAELYGADGSLEFDLLKELTLFGNIAYVVGRDRKSHDRLNTIPPLNGILGARWHDQLSNGLSYWFEFSGNFYDRQDHPATGEKETAGYSFFNFRSGVKFDYLAFKDITLTLNIENLFDKEYRNHLNIADFYNEPGLNVITSLKFSF
ncbi:MAG: TonB-dependent receptor [Pseudomonadota bacterium]|nr:TonB-dependent receptor [Pseudomonadota bacterium]